VLSGLDRIRFRGTQRLLASLRGMTQYQGERIKIHPNCCVELDSDK